VRCLATLAVALVAASLAPASASAAPSSLASAKKRAASLSAQIEAQGEKLSIADERYNEASSRRAELADSVAKARVDAAAAEKRWAALRARLNTRVKTLYMHPGAPFAAWLNMRSLSEDGRARVLSDSVLTSDSTLVSQTDRARRDVLAVADKLSGLRSDAERNLEAIASERERVASALSRQQALLSNVKGDIAQLIAADRQRELDKAKQQAAEHAPVAAQVPAPAAGGGDTTPSSTPSTKSDQNLPKAPAPSAGAATALDVARAQIGKPYKWAAAGPDSFDCSGLTMYAWGKAGVQLPHSAAGQYDMLPKVSRGQLAPGDLVFFGSPIHHVGIYEGGGIMINAPQTGENVRRDAIDRSDYAGAARP
jgi:cell wall-associated NlpC family hydrolase